jgi:GrpB-like predicted nucleotidyltransferase (UPF0157 family)
VRTHHIHMVEASFVHWQALLFRDYLRTHTSVAREYEDLKRRLAGEYPNDREAYTNGKSDFVRHWTEAAKRESDLERSST